MLIWTVAEPDRLRDDVKAAIALPANDVFVSAASAWEIAIKHALGRLEFPVEQYDAMLDRMGFETLPITHGHAIAAGGLPRHHQDPFDRILVAQARMENLVLVSDDGLIAQYDVQRWDSSAV